MGLGLCGVFLFTSIRAKRVVTEPGLEYLIESSAKHADYI